MDRSTKAGAFTPATHGILDFAVVDGPRSTKAGAFTPATLEAATWPAVGVTPLNEGRGVHPGDTLEPPRVVRADELQIAQRRPGRSPRRHLSRHLGDLFTRRSTKAGAFTPATPPRAAGPSGSHAQRRPGRSPRRHSKVRRRACAETPAQRRPGRSPRRREGGINENHQTLNEGRGVHPGDTRAGAGATARVRSTRPGRLTPATLNEGRGVHPGDTGRSPRRHERPGARCGGGRRPAQRRPGRSPRRHCYLCRKCGLPTKQGPWAAEEGSGVAAGAKSCRYRYSKVSENKPEGVGIASDRAVGSRLPRITRGSQAVRGPRAGLPRGLGFDRSAVWRPSFGRGTCIRSPSHGDCRWYPGARLPCERAARGRDGTRRRKAARAARISHRPRRCV